MKICFVTSNIFSSGGVQRVTTVLANELVKYNEVDILCTSDKYKPNYELYNLNKSINVEINGIMHKKRLISKLVCKSLMILNNKTGIFNNNKYINILNKVYFPGKIQKNFLEYLNTKKYDVIIAVEALYSMLIGSIANELNAKTIGWQHNSYEAYFQTKDKYCWNIDKMFKSNISKLDKCVVLTEHDKNKIEEKMGIKSICIYNPLSFTSEQKSNCNNRTILSVGRLVQEQKGFDLLLDAYKIVSKKYPNWKLIIVGDGPDKEKLEDKISELQLINNVEIRPFTTDVNYYYLNSSIFVSSSRWEGFGLVITEAMECGLPVVAFANSGPKEIINKNGINGILVPTKNVKELALQIISLIENHDKRKDMSIKAIERAQDFKVKRVAERWNRVLELL
ncbi:glycosyltransferase family 4 protein [Clostridium beijerinckii]|uniref:Glycosyltransferase involved in cell wall biosynthesis n=1 Tax=Clostridium beijerinckii TaxID=1520 RepID=A0AAE5LS85_CLOBE|nr:glycosyltransferase family 4 protein [Clostridium beijerinckii]NSB16581.1 glycosyltransferase involved in cell wall biosynthesis [Clostridium beijerinckii]OOM26680.1 putative poly(glycerol-phosphate) alpha-glucosyltransferase [Clostridium beijerinckii]